MADESRPMDNFDQGAESHEEVTSSLRSAQGKLFRLPTSSLSEDELLALWQVARREALRCCASTLARLHAGDGGFYEAEDFWQDLFIAFWGLVKGWLAAAPREEQAPDLDRGQALWAAWRRLLRRGGARLLRRAPMRLWARQERPMAPYLLALEDELCQGPEAGDPGSPLDPAALEALTQPEDAEAGHLRQACLDDLEAALWALRPGQRQVIFMATLAELPAAEVARLLGLSEGNAISQRLFAARAALRWLLRGQG